MRYTTELMIVAALLGQPSINSATSGQPAVAGKASSDNRLTTELGFTVDYPKKDWKPVVGVGSALVVFVHKSGQVTVAIERTRVEHPLAPDEITDQTAKLEIEDWQARRPLASGFTHTFTDIGGRVIVIDFVQSGAQENERVRMYALPRGADWYRVICTGTAGSFNKYLDTCHRVALTLTPTR
jgi:hypothetical protein